MNSKLMILLAIVLFLSYLALFRIAPSLFGSLFLKKKFNYSRYYGLKTSLDRSDKVVLLWNNFFEKDLKKFLLDTGVFSGTENCEYKCQVTDDRR